VLLTPPAYTKPHVKRGNNDAVDAEAICASGRVRACGSFRSKTASNKRR